MAAEPVPALIERYVAALNSGTRHERRTALSELATEDFTFAGPLGEYRTLAQFLDFLDEVFGTGPRVRFVVTSRIDAPGPWARYTWEVVGGTTPLAGMDVVRVQGGKLTALVVFAGEL